MVAWVFAAIGLFWRASAIVTALGFFYWQPPGRTTITVEP